MFKSTIKYLVVTGLAVGVAPIHAYRNGWPRHNALMRQMEDFWRDFDGFSDSDWPPSSRDAQAVPLPEVTVEKKDEAAIVVIKGLTAKDDEIKAVNETKKEYVQYTFPYQDSKITLTVIPDALEMKGEMTITQEKKDPKGKVLSSSSYDATNFISKSVPFIVDVSKAKKEYKNGVLTITLPEREELVSLPKMSVREEADAIKLEIKGLSAKPEDIKGVYDEESDYIQYSFPYKNSTATLTIVSPESRFKAPYVYVKGITTITHEEKDPKGKVLSTSNQNVERNYVETLPTRVNLSKTKRDYKDGILTITLASRHAKREI